LSSKLYPSESKVVERTTLDGRHIVLLDLDDAQEVNQPQEKAPKKKWLTKKENEGMGRVAKEKEEKEKAEKKEAEIVQSQANELMTVPSQSHETTPMSNHGHDDALHLQLQILLYQMLFIPLVTKFERRNNSCSL